MSYRTEKSENLFLPFQAGPDGPGRMLNKVPEVILSFWIIKIMATTIGETAADLLNYNLHLGLTVTSAVMGLLLAVMMFLQLRADRYVPWIYWLTIVFISVFGTLISDNLVDAMGVSLETTTILFAALLAATFTAWFATERTLSIHTIHTTRREIFYWAAILFTFALGTAAGDLMSEGLNLGYGLSAVIFGAMIAVVAAAYYLFNFNAVTAFWMAYVLTRPFGASCGDFLSQSMLHGGLGLGTVDTSLVFLAVIVLLVWRLTVQQKRHAAKE